MGRCIICGAAVEGRVCDTHEEDVVFEFRGDRPDQLVAGRYYEGSVDGYADFGVFVDVGEHVTGLLHESELDRRLEGLDWEPDDTVYVQVLRVRDNGNVDLGWSIRQTERDFRGRIVQDPGADEPERLPDEDEAVPNGGGTTTTPEPGPVDRGGPVGETEEGADGSTDATVGSGDATAGSTDAATVDADAGGPGGETAPGRADEAAVDRSPEPPASTPERAAVESLSDRVGERVAVEGEVVGVRQTGGPTVFEVRDETGAVDVAAFVEAGVRAYPDVETDDVVRVVGEVELRREELQVESEAVEALAGQEADAVRGRLADALAAEARPDDLDLLADHPPVGAVDEALLDAAEAVRRAVLQTRPIVVRHAATADGYVAGAAIERAALPLVREAHARGDAEYHYFDRRPLEDPVYGMDDATSDVTDMLQGRDRHDEKLPLVVLVAAGSTLESVEGLRLLDVYGVERVVVDAGAVDADVADAVETTVSPAVSDADGPTLTTAVLATNLAAAVNPDVRGDLLHLPAVSYWEDAPEAYVELAREAGYDAGDVRELREAVALEAYYQTYEDKRELVSDLLFGDSGARDAPDSRTQSGDSGASKTPREAGEAGDSEARDASGSRTQSGGEPDGDARGLAAHVSEQFREKLDRAVETARANVEVRTADDTQFTVLDAERFAHRFDFPPTHLLADELHRREREGDGQVTVVATADELYLRSEPALDPRELVEPVASAAPGAGVRAVGGRDGRLQFLSGERDAVLGATLGAIADALA